MTKITRIANGIITDPQGRMWAPGSRVSLPIAGRLAKPIVIEVPASLRLALEVLWNWCCGNLVEYTIRTDTPVEVDTVWWVDGVVVHTYTGDYGGTAWDRRETITALQELVAACSDTPMKNSPAYLAAVARLKDEA